ncbi:MAG TPA: hypothetical protein VNB89_11390 [Gemmatimonadaceae bacterium]|jgi:hypothetical protein|nr:hypothetical protein [Gemmatimonadaceae bacterium]
MKIIGDNGRTNREAIDVDTNDVTSDDEGPDERPDADFLFALEGWAAFPELR